MLCYYWNDLGSIPCGGHVPADLPLSLRCQDNLVLHHSEIDTRQ